MTDHEFFAAIAVGIPPITPPIRIGLDLATGSDTTVVAEVAADGTVTRSVHITEEQSPMTQLKAFYVDDMPTIYAAATPEEAARLYEEDVGDPCDDGYPREVSAAELDRSIPEFGEDEQPTGEMTTMRTWLEEASPGFLCGAE
ncbi:hypothetical protein C405_14608 [Stenotrophomonas maltophilia AU12-09]|uniref:hypothetical protein n=1 Tax=Stenotrophomonas maltophilia TaxID=40324 RepID=UPI0002BF8420|nr:hypothetical protein [Stenotrophomonas maltophilia]EMI48763.1 hypothetical protein C405_14608 [Stenotrophomonas maltophilia AU12-09]